MSLDSDSPLPPLSLFVPTLALAAGLLLAICIAPGAVDADETCMSPYMAKITG